MIIESPLELIFRDLFCRLPAFAGNHDVFLKLEGFNVTGSIKVNSAEPIRLQTTTRFDRQLDPVHRHGATLSTIEA